MTGKEMTRSSIERIAAEAEAELQASQAWLDEDNERREARRRACRQGEGGSPSDPPDCQ